MLLHPAFCIVTRGNARHITAMLRYFLLMMVVAGAGLSQVRAQLGDVSDDVGLRKRAESGDAESQFQLGLRLIRGEGVPKPDPVAGADWVQKAAKQDNERAMHVLAALYEAGEGVEKSSAKFVEWERKAADKDLPEAQLGMAQAYDLGEGVEKDPSQGAEWAMKAAEQGLAPAQGYFGAKLVRGDGVPKSAAKAALYFLKAAKQEDGSAQRQLAYLYYTGAGVPVDYKRCEAWYRRAARNEQDPWANNDLAWFLSTCPDKRFHNGPEAIETAKRAVRFLQDSRGEQRHEMLDTMAAALARNGQYTEAALWQRRCISLLKEDKALPDEEREKLAKEFDTRLKLYTEQKPYADEPTKPEGQSAPLPNDTILEDPDGTFQLPGPNQLKRGSRKKKDTEA